MKLEKQCEQCGETFIRYKKSGFDKARFCSRICVTEWKKIYVFPFHKAPWLTKLNQEPGRNAKISRDSVEKRTAKLRGKYRGGKKPTYPKMNGRHIHRQVIEKMIGRRLLPTEVVHHIDGDQNNYNPSNLQLTTKSKHTAHHSANKKGKVGDDL